MLNHAPAMRAIGKRVARLFKNMRCRDGNLCAGTVGQQPLGNPSERAPSAWYVLLPMREHSGVSRTGTEHRALSAGRAHRTLRCVYRGHHEGARVRPLSWPAF
eukprot:6561553-Pyramimonas_sp.AAC.1